MTTKKKNTPVAVAPVVAPVAPAVEAVEAVQAVAPVAVEAVEAVQAVAPAVAPVAPAVDPLGFDFKGLLGALSVKAVKTASPASVRVKAVELDIKQSTLQYVAFSLSFFGVIIPLNEIHSVAKKIDHSYLVNAVNASGLGSIDIDDNLSCSISAFNGASVRLEAIEKLSPKLTEAVKTSHQGLSFWAVSMLLKHLMITQALKTSKNLIIAPPAVFAYVNTSLGAVLASGLFNPMNDNKVKALSEKFGIGLVNSVSKYLFEVDYKSALVCDEDSAKSLISHAVEAVKASKNSASAPAPVAPVENKND